MIRKEYIFTFWTKTELNKAYDIKGEFQFLRLWTLFLDLLLSTLIKVFSIFAFAPVKSEGSPKLLNLAS